MHETSGLDFSSQSCTLDTFHMDARDKRKLIKNFVRLVAETPVEEVVPYLREKRILSGDHAEEILYQNTEKNKVRQLLFTLIRRGPNAFSAFVEALRSSDCTSLVELLECI